MLTTIAREIWVLCNLPYDRFECRWKAGRRKNAHMHARTHTYKDWNARRADNTRIEHVPRRTALWLSDMGLIARYPGPDIRLYEHGGCMSAEWLLRIRRNAMTRAASRWNWIKRSWLCYCSAGQRTRLTLDRKQKMHSILWLWCFQSLRNHWINLVLRKMLLL